MKIEIEIKIPDSELKNILSQMAILIDSREKSNNHIIEYFEKNNINYKVQKLEIGDYSYMFPKNQYWDQDIYFTNKFVIERKASLEELATNFAQDRLRIENEFAEIYDKDIKMHMIIENAKYDDIINNNYKTKYHPNAFNGSFLSFADRYNFSPYFINKENIGSMIYSMCKYNFKNIIK